MKLRKLLSLILAAAMLLGCMCITAFADTTASGTADLDEDKNASKDIEQNYNFTQTSEEYTDVSKVKLEWTITDIAATYESHKTWDADKMQWVEAKEDISAADHNAAFTLTNYSSTFMKASVSFAVEDAVKDTYDDANSTFANNNCTIATPVVADSSIIYDDSDFTALAQTVTATLKFNKDKFADLSAAASATKYGTYTVTISEANYLTFSSEGSFTLGATSLGFTTTDDAYLQYSTDSSNWTKWDGSAIPAVQNGEKYFVYLRGKGLTSLTNPVEEKMTNLTLTPAGGLKQIDMNNLSENPYEESELIDCTGNIMTLLDYDNPNNVKMGEFAFYLLFGNLDAADFDFSGSIIYASPLRTAPSLPATTLADYCYSNMFCGCTSLSSAPALPATTLTDYCYTMMFAICTSLTTAPALPATTLAENCYYAMFSNCTSLTTAPALPATTLTKYCYYAMFTNCTSLTTAPALPATTLADYCYSNMFLGCTSLKISTEGSENNKIFTCPPTIPAHAVKNMFSDGSYNPESKIRSVTAGTTYYWYTE